MSPLPLLLLAAAPIRFVPAPATVEQQDFAEARLEIDAPKAANCFTGASLSATLTQPDGSTIPLQGFCDDPAGSLFKVRFLARFPGAYRYTVDYSDTSGLKQSFSGAFTAAKSARKGIVKTDPQYPAHFVWEGTGQHYFWNSTTTYALMGWDDANIRRILDRFHSLGVNRLRVAIQSARVDDGNAWFEPKVIPTKNFSFLTTPWAAQRPESVGDPGWDVTRFNLPYWQKFERMLALARERDIVISVIFYVDGRRPGVDPFGGPKKAGAEDERRYYRYAAARFSAFTNVMWDVTNEWHLFRTQWWVEQFGALLRAADPYGHLISCHGRGEFPWSTSPWAGFAMYQIWDESGGYKPMLDRRRKQEAAGRLIPQINEEYGYEDHYPQGWGGARKAPSRVADNRRRLAWEMTMAGCYQTTGERADTGAGGWINGGGDDSMTLLTLHRHLVRFFESFDWWKLDPSTDGVSPNAMLLARHAERYVVYLPGGGSATFPLAAGRYRARWYDPRTGAWQDAPAIDNPETAPWRSPASPSPDDWALLIERQ